MPASAVDRAGLLSNLAQFAVELAFDGRRQEAAAILKGATRWFAPPDGIDEEIALANATVQLGVLQAELGAYDDALRSLRRVYERYWGEKEDQDLLEASARAWFEKSLVLLRSGKITEATEALLGTITGPYWGNAEQLAHFTGLVERMSTICDTLNPGDRDAFKTLLMRELPDVTNATVRTRLEGIVQAISRSAAS